MGVIRSRLMAIRVTCVGHGSLLATDGREPLDFDQATDGQLAAVGASCSGLLVPHHGEWHDWQVLGRVGPGAALRTDFTELQYVVGLEATADDASGARLYARAISSY